MEAERGERLLDEDRETSSPFPAGTTTNSPAAIWGVVAASDMIFATDWPPPGSTALTEEPVSLCPVCNALWTALTVG